MITAAKQLHGGICGDDHAGGRSRSRLLVLYTRSIFGGRRKNPLRASAACGARLRCGCKIDGERLRNEDDKLSTEPGQLQ